MKRSTLLILALVLSLALVLVGCGKEEAKKTEPNGETTGTAQTEGTAQGTEGNTTEATEEPFDTNPEGDPGLDDDEGDPGVDIYLPGGGNNMGTNENPNSGSNEGSGEGNSTDVTTPSVPEVDNGEDDFEVDFGDLLG